MAFIPQLFNIPTFVTGATFTPRVELPGSYLFVYVIVPTMTAGYSTASTPIFINGSADGTTFYRYSNVETNTNTVGTNDFTIVSATSSRIINIPNFALRYIELEISGTCTTPAAAGQFKLVCVSNQ